MNFNYKIENDEKKYRKINKLDLDKFLDKKQGELEFSKELKTINEYILLVSYDFVSLFSSAQLDIYSTWPKMEAVCPPKRILNEIICSLFNSA